MTKNIYFAHRKPKDFSDRVALYLMRLLRWGTDLATGAFFHIVYRIRLSFLLISQRP
jgi:hypothetical protein